jgi:hypothetical protein
MQTKYVDEDYLSVGLIHSKTILAYPLENYRNYTKYNETNPY